MKIYYNNNNHNCSWKSELKPNEWANFDPVKIKMTLPKDEYLSIIKEIRSHRKVEVFEDFNRTTEEFNFSLLVSDKDKSKMAPGLYKVESNFDRGTIASEYKNGNVDVIIKTTVFEYELCGKQEMRDLVLNDLFKK